MTALLSHYHDPPAAVHFPHGGDTVLAVHHIKLPITETDRDRVKQALIPFPYQAVERTMKNEQLQKKT